MATIATAFPPSSFGATSRRDLWWLEPLVTFVVFSGFVVYGNLAVFWPQLFGHPYFEIRKNETGEIDWEHGEAVAPYLAPFYSPLIYDARSHHAWIQAERPSWWPGWMPFSSAMLILIFPLGFRLTCYYYRKAYYRAFWADPPACAVGEPRKGYRGENRWPLLIQNIHRYFLYAALVFIVFLASDALRSFFWPVIQEGRVTGWTFGFGLGSLLLCVNVVLISLYTFGCHSFRHLIGGRQNCFSCPINGEYRPTQGYRWWRMVSQLNEHHQLWAWASMLWIGFTDLYIRLCAMGVWSDPHVTF
jgi:hypothetical protein